MREATLLWFAALMVLTVLFNEKPLDRKFC
jgi:hypothetical protein